jgi:hypothetical protein
MEEVDAGLIDIDAVSKEVMKSVLGPYVQFDRGKQEFVFTEKWDKLNNNLKLLTYLVGRKGLYAASYLNDEEAASPSTMVEQTHMPGGSVSYTLKVLFDGNIIAKTESGKYYVPNAKLLITAGMIRDAQGREAPEGVAIKKMIKRKRAREGRKAGG